MFDEPNEPPFGGAGMSKDERQEAHKRWYSKLLPHPQTLPPGSVAFRNYEEGRRCGACAFYIPLTSDLGMDWGGCGNELSVFDKHVIFECHSCSAFEARA
jgi:hypothetical protein